ncbi:hypothetical protein FA95DRAFT_1552801 [Auriscalpium vulgare]|uniref:Uncharacterized protein n=1 Tax=Auriscalpium vulgare TaxID=40419 RepID=A0ACB8S9V9_9AGAM|nr:hypothetical protein FA95DRAFT_1552801 [Auriscalpium vulgare]
MYLTPGTLRRSDFGESIATPRARSLLPPLKPIRSESNASNPASRMLPELLACLFEFVRDADPPSRSRDATCRGCLGWIHVTHVCQSWREAGIGHPHLWTDVDFNVLPHPWIKTFLTRSKAMPIHVTLDGGRSDTGDDLDIPAMIALIAAQSVTERLQTLRILSATFLHSCLALVNGLQLFVHPAPNLKELYILPGEQRWDHLRFDLPPHLFSGTAPRLTTLGIGSFPIPFNFLLLGNLTHLEMSLDIAHRYSDQPAHLSVLFDRMPKLRALYLRRLNQSDGREVDLTPLPRPIRLPPTLRYLCIKGNVALVAFTLNFTIPPAARVSVRPLCWSAGISTALTALLLPHCAAPLRPLKTLALTVDGSVGAVLDAWQMPAAIAKRKKPDLHFEFPREWPARYSGCVHLPMHEVQEIHFHICCNIGNRCCPEEGLTAFHAMREAQSVRRLYCGMPLSSTCRQAAGFPVLIGLLPTPSTSPAHPVDDALHGAAPTDGLIPFPSLETLKINDTTKDGLPEDEIFVDALVDCLRQRMDHDLRLCLLTLPPRFDKPQWAAALQPLAREVRFG